MNIRFVYLIFPKVEGTSSMKAVLFDLDNTLILYDEAAFYQRYFREASKVFNDIMGAEEFFERTVDAIKAIFAGDGKKTNADIFLEIFAEDGRLNKEEIWDRFLHFYETGYDDLKGEIFLPGSVKDVFKRLQKLGMVIVLASNPIFPLGVQIKRLAWGGLESHEFDLVTHIENMCFCTPKSEYYMEISEKIKIDPRKCLMVGNDPLNDMAASLAGMKTFLTNDAGKMGESALELTANLNEKNVLKIPEPDFQGPLSGVISAVTKLL